MEIGRLINYVNEHYSDLLKSMFKGVEFRGRFTVERELDYLSSESEEKFKIKKGKQKEHFSIYFDDEFICSFIEDDTPLYVDQLFLKGFLEQYEAGNIYLTPELRDEAIQQAKYDRIMKEEAKKAEMRKGLEGLNADEKEIAVKVLDEVA